MDLWWYLIGKNNYMFRPVAAIFRLLQFCSKSIIYMPILRCDGEISSSLRVKISLFSGKSNGQWLIVTDNDDEISASPRNIGIYMIPFEQNCNNLKTAAWPKHVVIYLLLNTIINPYYHSCVFMTDICLTISVATCCSITMWIFVSHIVGKT